MKYICNGIYLVYRMLNMIVFIDFTNPVWLISN